MTFAHLHVHSEYSLLDGSIRISKLISKVKEWGHSAVAITDHGNMFGAIEFYSKAKAENIKAILGSEVYVDEAFHLVLLAKDLTGYKNLMKIVSNGYTVGLKDIPICSSEFILQNAEGLIALSACYKGELSTLARQLRLDSGVGALKFDDSCEAYTLIKNHLQKMHAAFGKDDFYIELVDNLLPEQQKLLFDLELIAKHFNIPLVASADAHYLDKSFEASHAVMLGIKAGLTMTQIRSRNTNARFHLLTPTEFHDAYSRWPEAIANTNIIAEKCNVKLELGKFFLPNFPLDTDETLDNAFDRIAREMLEKRFVELKTSEEKKPEYLARLDYEIKMIVKMGFTGYFLIVQDFINWAKENGIPVGPGRGSGAGSLVAFSLRITDIDPLRFNLLFERFLNPERISMPDFDVDFCQDRRDEVIQYVTQKYGKDHVAQITTFGKMMCKAAIRDVGRVLEIGYGKVDRITKMIPNKMPDGKAPTIKDAIANEPRIREEMDRDDNIARMMQIAADLEGLNRQTGVHAAGIVMSDGPLTDYVPVYTTADDGFITQYEMKNAEKVGLVKFDFLGLKTLTVIDNAVKEIHRTKNPDFNISNIPLDDKKVYHEVSAAHSIGVFQLEGQGMQNLLVKLKPSSFEDIIAVVALFRPGPLGSGMVDDFIERKHGRQKIDYMLPQLEPILRETYGVILYQEQVQKIASVLASYTPGEADLLRRAMGKKIQSEMDAQKVRFVDGAIKNGVSSEQANEIFDLMAKFAEYGFNKSHSAAYGLVSYQTAYLKAHFPEEFMAASMTCDMGDTDKVVRYVEDCRRMKIKVLPPNINRSTIYFDVPEPKKIGYALAAIKGVGADSLRPMIAEREANGPFKDLTDFARRLNLHIFGKKNLELLTLVGALDDFKIDRKKFFKIIPELIQFSVHHFESKKSRQRSLFDDDTDGVTNFSYDKNEVPSALDMEALLAERKLTGCFLTKHPIDLFPADQKKFGTTTLRDIDKFVNKGAQPIVVMLFDFQERRNKENRPMAYVSIEDQTTRVEAVMNEKFLPKQPPLKDMPYVAWVGVSKKQDGTISRPRIERLLPLSEARAETMRDVLITLNVKEDWKSCLEKVNQLRELAKKYPGDKNLKLKLRYEKAILDFALEDMKVQPTDDFMMGIGKLNEPIGIIN